MSVERQGTPLALSAIIRNRPSDSSPPSAVDRYLVNKLLKLSGSPRIEIELWDGSKYSISEKPPVATMRINNRSAFHSLIFQTEIGFGDGYTEGEIEIKGSLVEFLCEIYSARDADVDDSKVLMSILSAVSKRKVSENSLDGSQSNIHHHYDLGNDFYSLWLDQDHMQYTCAYFPSPDVSIEQAQEAKMEHVCRKLMLKPGQTVVEAGCGWGGLARYMAREHGVTVKSYNISHQQIIYATERAAAEGLSDRVEFIEDDYRNIKGEYDIFVSVGMLEHVGSKHYVEFGGVIDRCLKENGRALIHSIGRNAPALMSAWIEKRIFPGAYPPTIREMMDIVEPYRFSVLDVENLRLHYAETLRHWLHRFDQNEQTVVKMFDERFVRAWRLYLTGSIAAFLTSSLQLFQMLFARGTDNSVPTTRSHLYIDTKN